MKPEKWLESLTDKKYRPSLSYAYQFDLFGEPVTLATNGYVMGWVNGHLQADPIVTFKKSFGADGEAAAWLSRINLNVEPIVNAEIHARLKVNALSLKRAVEQASAYEGCSGTVRFWYDPAGVLHVFNRHDYKGVTLYA